MRWHWLRRALKFVVLLTVVLSVLGFVVMSLWNWLIPTLFAGPKLNFWQALGLLLLSRILVGGLRGGHMHHGYWRHRLRERWERMTPEERKNFRHRLHHHCGWAKHQTKEPEA